MRSTRHHLALAAVPAALAVLGTLWLVALPGPVPQPGAARESAAQVVAAAAPVPPTATTTATTTSATTTATTSAAPDPATPTVSPAWVDDIARRTGVPSRALLAYATAQLRAGALDPGCGVRWSTLAGIGWVESHHGGIDGRVLDRAGRPSTPIIGIALAGGPGIATVPDSDAGRLDLDPAWDRAVGPMQFVPGTWSRWASDGDDDGRADPQDLDDAALAAARYLCASGGELTETGAWHRAVLSYNASSRYAADVLATANTYAIRSTGG